ncbi:immunity 22 family protein [Metabacillus fastidiosus]|uniref:immunity 22 family protein n=1 Tax=Metabacillus fastidiosus TaxID=1458 RepID=UPI002E1E575E|nr:immunity 22 family protein [Metabacillus fastidiosus]
MEHIVTIWGCNFKNEEELESYVEAYKDGENAASEFANDIGLMWLDEDFMEIAFLASDKEQAEIIDYLNNDYSDDNEFTEQLPASLLQDISPYNSIILLYGNKSIYGSINEELFRMEKNLSLESCSDVRLVAGVVYET